MHNFVLESQTDELIYELERERKKRFHSENLLKQLQDEYNNFQKDISIVNENESTNAETQYTHLVTSSYNFIKL